MAEVVYTKNAPDAIGPYSQAMKVGNLVFTSGQIAIDPATGNVEATTIEEQTHQVCKNLTNVLITLHVFALKRSTNSSTFYALLYAAWASWALSGAGCALTAAAVCAWACSRSISSCAEWKVAWA